MKPTQTYRRLFTAFAILMAACAAVSADQKTKSPRSARDPGHDAIGTRSLDGCLLEGRSACLLHQLHDCGSPVLRGVRLQRSASLQQRQSRRAGSKSKRASVAIKQDDTHKLGDRPPSWTSPGTSTVLDDDIPVLSREIWRETDKQYRAAAQALIKVKTSQQVQVQTAEGAAPDFSPEAPRVYTGPRVEMRVDRKPWEARVRKYTAAFSKSPAVLEFHRHVHRARLRTSTK